MKIGSRSFMALLLGAGLFAGSASHAGILAGKGVRAGVTVANLRGDFADLVETDRRVGFAGGGFLRVYFPGPAAVQTELLYVMKGATTQIEVTDNSGTPLGTGTITYQVDYVEIPVLLRVTLGEAGPVQPSLLLGPSLGVKVRSRLAYDGPGPDMSGDLDQVEDTDFGVVGGVELEFGHAPARLMLDARYTLGLANVMKPPSLVDARTSTFAIIAGFGF